MFSRQVVVMFMGLLSLAEAQNFGSQPVKQRPVSKVINLLKDMQDQLGKEQEEDQEVFDQFACWCETNEKLKTKAIADAELKIKNLGSSIEELTAKSAQLTTDIATLEEAITKGKAGLAEATSVRDKELAEFNQDDKDAIVAIKGLHGAVQVLGGHNAGAALSQEALVQLHQALAPHVSHVELRRLGLASKQQRMVASFLQQPTGATSYNSNSGEIFGVLQAMKESFETNMDTSRKEEKQGASDFAGMKDAKTKELAAATSQRDSKENELAKTDEENANSKIDLKDTTAQLEADSAFLADLKTRCAAMDKEWAARQQMRQDETTAISEALKILTDDDARELMSKTTGFLQSSMSLRSAGKAAAARVLRTAAQKLGKPRLAMLAEAMKGDVFSKIKENIDGMVAQLSQETKDEIKHRDYCIEELHQNTLSTDEEYHEKSNLETRQADLESSIKKLTEDIAAAESEVAETQIQMKKSSETRAQESKDFHVIIVDARATQDILGKAVDKLNEFYARKAALLQMTTKKAAQAPPPTFEPYKKAGGGGVVAMIEGIIAESKLAETHAISDNNDSQLAYEEFMKDSNKSIKTLRKEITDKSAQKATDDADLERVKADLVQNFKDLEALNDVSNNVHSDCDFVLKNFEQRQADRTNEMDALNEAKAMMSQA